MKNVIATFLVLTALLSQTAHAEEATSPAANRTKAEVEEAKARIRSGVSNMVDELDPFDTNVGRTLEIMDMMYEEESGTPATLEDNINELLFKVDGRPACQRAECPIWLEIVKSKQVANFYRNGQLEKSWKVSSGDRQHTTPNFDKNPDGRIYDRYESTKFPGGGFKNLGNMPYAVFISGGFAVHGTAAIGHLGTIASHGCIRQHPDNAKYFNREVRAQQQLPGGLRNVWITVRN